MVSTDTGDVGARQRVTAPGDGGARPVLALLLAASAGWCIGCVATSPSSDDLEDEATDGDSDEDDLGDDDSVVTMDDDSGDDDTWLGIPYSVSFQIQARGMHATYEGKWEWGYWGLDHVVPHVDDLCTEAWTIVAADPISDGVTPEMWGLGISFASIPTVGSTSDLTFPPESFYEDYAEVFEYWLFNRFRDVEANVLYGWFGGTAVITSLDETQMTMVIERGESCALDEANLGMEGSRSDCLEGDGTITLTEQDGRMLESLEAWKEEPPEVSSAHMNGVGWCMG